MSTEVAESPEAAAGRRRGEEIRVQHPIPPELAVRVAALTRPDEVPLVSVGAS